MKYLWALLLFIIFSASEAFANQWESKPYGLIARDETLQTIVSDFAASIGVPAIVSEKLDSKINGEFPRQSAVKFLKQLSSISNLSWYFDGYALYFYRADEVANLVLHLKYFKPSELHQLLSLLPWWDKRNHWTAIEEKGLVFISGPPRFIELVNETSKLLDNEVSRDEQSRFSIQVFPLKYAFADDKKVKYRGGERLIPGIASLLKQATRPAPAISSPDTKPHNLLALGQVHNGEKAKGADVQNPTPMKEKAQIQPVTSFIQADPRMNSVIIGDTKERLKLYASMIEQLDQPTKQVEVNVSIINIRADNLEELGINWETYGNDGSFRFGENPSEVKGKPGQLSIMSGDWLGFSSVLGNTRSYFLARINLLAEEGKATISSRPSVLTLDNEEAVLDSSSTFFVKLTGEREVALEEVSVGTVVKVTPHIQQDEGQAIRLDIHIEDGNREVDKVDELPIISNTMITTQSVVRPKQSLLIGGYYFDSKTESENHVPILGELPLVGALFRNTSTNHVNMVRLFLITPRLVSSDMHIPNETQYLNDAERLKILEQ